MGLLVLLHAMYLSNLLDGNLTVTFHPPTYINQRTARTQKNRVPPENASVTDSKQNGPQCRKSLSLLAWAIAT